ncbi:MAG: O-antigen ligase family protein [Bacteroidota bacterium]
MKPATRISNGIIFLFTVIMFFRIVTYFELVEEKSISAVIKAGTRFLWTGVSYLLYRYLRVQGNGFRFYYRSILSMNFYFLYLLLGLWSFIWSTNVPYSAKQWAMDLECVAFVFFFWKAYLAYNQNPYYTKKIGLGKLLYSSTVIVAIWFLIGMFEDPESYLRLTHGGNVARLGGYIINPNELGMLGAVGIAGMYAEVKHNGFKKGYLIGFLLIVWMMIETGSRSSQIGLFLVTFYMVLTSGNKRLITGTLVAGAILAPIVFNQVFLKEGDMDEVMSMTGRGPFWKDLLTTNLPKEPFLGFGFMRIAYTDRFESINFPGGMAHNTFIQVVMNLGLVGFFSILVQMVLVWRSHYRHEDPYTKTVMAAVFFPIFINSLTEFGIFGDANYGILFWLFIVFGLVVHAEHKPERGARWTSFPAVPPRLSTSTVP